MAYDRLTPAWQRTGLPTGRREEITVSQPESLPFEPAPPPPKIAAKVGGWLFPLLLRSPLHRLLPHHLLLITVTYRDTGQERTLPMEYHVVDGKMLVVTQGRWRHQVSGGAPVVVTMQGKRHPARAEVEEDPDEVARVYKTLLGPGLENAGSLDLIVKEHREPTLEELKALTAGTALVYLELEGSSPSH
jgi:hypothetical protein